MSFEVVFDLPHPAATDALGTRLAAILQPGDVIALEGPLGSGKTALARAIVRTLTNPLEEVPSPTFTLVQGYDTPRLSVSHYDLYRLKHAREMDELGLDEALENGAALIEWPERAEDRLPADRLTIALHADGAVRQADLSGPARWQVLSYV